MEARSFPDRGIASAKALGPQREGDLAVVATVAITLQFVNVSNRHLFPVHSHKVMCPVRIFFKAERKMIGRQGPGPVRAW